MKKIGLALSGGGFRASLYHLGLVRFLRDAGILPQVTHITSVSGGSDAGHLIGNDFGGPGDEPNLVLMDETLNRAGGSWWAMERELAHLATGNKVRMRVNVHRRDLECRLLGMFCGPPPQTRRKWLGSRTCAAPAAGRDVPGVSLSFLRLFGN
jgi:hypothetical protein